MKDINIYTESGYIDFNRIYEVYNPTMLIIIGARGIGKTYGALKYLTEHDYKFALIRRTASEREFIRNEEFNPLTALYTDGLIPEFKIDGGKYSDSYYYIDNPDSFAVSFSIATASKIRGIDGRSISYFMYDEFIKDNNEKALKDEAGGFFQLMETIGRNRELNGEPPIKSILCANSNNIFNPICDTLKLTDVLIDMRDRGKEQRYIKQKDILLIDVKRSPISEKKKETYLYRLTKGTDFYNMAISNRFYNDISTMVGTPYPFREYKPFAEIQGVHILKHTSTRLLYVSVKNRGVAKYKYFRWIDFFKDYNLLIQTLVKRGALFFESADLAAYFKDFLEDG